jgi:hypothetical protein
LTSLFYSPNIMLGGGDPARFIDTMDEPPGITLWVVSPRATAFLLNFSPTFEGLMSPLAFKR